MDGLCMALIVCLSVLWLIRLGTMGKESMYFFGKWSRVMLYSSALAFMSLVDVDVF